MRDRLIKLIKQAKKQTKNANCDIERNMIFADYLLANGVIVPPVKAGDKIFKINTQYAKYVSEETVEPYGVAYKNILGGYALVPFDDIGKSVFLTKEEAERALKGGEG